MAKSNGSSLPPASPEHRRIAAGQFDRASRAEAAGQFDYAIRLYLSCCQLDPANLIYRQALRRTAKAKYRNNLRGGWLAWLTGWTGRTRVRAALRARDFAAAMGHGEAVLAKNPWDLGAQRDLAEAAEAVGLIDTAVWVLEQARPKRPTDAALNRALARMYQKRGDLFQARGLWQQVLKRLPDDLEAAQKVKELAVAETIARGDYEAALRPGGRADSDAEIEAVREPPARSQQSSPASPHQAEAGTGDSAPEEASPLRALLEADPTNSGLYLQLARLFRRLGESRRARAVLQEGLAATGNAFNLAVELTDLEIEPFRVNLTIAEEQFNARPQDEELRRLRLRLRKEVNTRELELMRQKADRFPQELSWRYEVGVRLLRGGQIDEAVRELQAARDDPRCRWHALVHLGHCYKASGNDNQAQKQWEQAWHCLPADADASRRKEGLFLLATGSADAGDLVRALEAAQELTELDPSYREIGRRREEWRTRLGAAKVS
jgi:tetratricopeptide (TPR) repeat protein